MLQMQLSDTVCMSASNVVEVVHCGEGHLRSARWCQYLCRCYGLLICGVRLLLCRCIAKLRGNSQLLHTDEWKAYTEVGSHPTG
jgi:hypothetical protein